MPTAVVRLAVDRARAERLADLAAERLGLGAVSVAAFEMTDGSGWTVEIYSGPNREADAFEAAVREALGTALDGVELTAETIADADWVAQSLAGLDPVRAGRFVVHGAHDRSRVPPNAIGIQVEAALAFGTGHHGTTRGCLLALDALLKRRRPERVLDLGAGTGVLAIAAAKALRSPVLATDIDPMSVRIASENARLNAVADRVRVVLADGLRHPEVQGRAPYDLIFANILAGPLVALAPAIAATVAPGGSVILSGLLERQARAVRAAYSAHGLRIARASLLEGWATLILGRA